MSFGSPAVLVLLAAVPAATGAYVWHERRRETRAAVWARPALLPNMVERPPAWRRHLPVALLLAGVTLLLVGFARPHARVSVQGRDATLVLVLDVSGSMAARDVQPSRLAAARAAAERFVTALPRGYRVSVVTFSDHAAVVAPPTGDLVRVRSVLTQARTGPRGTALTDAIWHAVDVARSVPPDAHGRFPPASAVVFSDGGQTSGVITPRQAAAKATRARVPFSTVAIGTPAGVVEQQLRGGFVERIEVPVQPLLLQRFAEATGGRYFAGTSAVDVAGILHRLESRVGHHHKTVEVTSVAAGGGLAFMLAGALLSGLWFRRLV